jgi:hypothetical protein
MLMRIYGPMGGEVTDLWGKMHNNELHILYSSQSIMKVIKGDVVGGAWSTHGEMKNACKVLDVLL